MSERRVVRGAVERPDGAEDRLDFGKGANDTVLFLEQCEACVMEIPGSAVGM